MKETNERGCMLSKSISLCPKCNTLSSYVIKCPSFRL